VVPCGDGAGLPAATFAGDSRRGRKGRKEREKLVFVSETITRHWWRGRAVQVGGQ